MIIGMSCETPDYSIDTVEQTVLDNMDYEEVVSVAKAKVFVTAMRRWLLLRPNSASQSGNSLTLNAEQANEMLRRAQEYVTANTGKSNVRFLSMEGFSR